MMPEIDGLELMKIVKSDNPNLPVIMITGYATINTALQATQLGAFDYVAKPFSKKELIATVRRAADLVMAGKSEPEKAEAAAEASRNGEEIPLDSFRSIFEKSWMMLEEDGVVLLGVERSVLETVGRIQTVYLPSSGDEIRQGSVYMQLFSSDVRSHNVVSPLSGHVVDVNKAVLDDPNEALSDPYGEGWVLRIRPTRFDFEIKLLGL